MGKRKEKEKKGKEKKLEIGNSAAKYKSLY